MFMIRYSSKSLGQKIKEVHVTQCFRVEHRHWVNNGNNDYELRYFIQPICFNRRSRVTYWTLWFQERWLMSRSQPNVPQIQLQVTGADGQNLRERWFLRVQVWGKGNICNPGADHGAPRRCDHLNVFGLLFRWYFTDMLHIWPAQHHLHVEQNQKQARELYAFLQAESEVYDLSLKFLLNGIILHKSINQWTLSCVVPS